MKKVRSPTILVDINEHYKELARNVILRVIYDIIGNKVVWSDTHERERAIKYVFTDDFDFWLEAADWSQYKSAIEDIAFKAKYGNLSNKIKCILRKRVKSL